jgi:F-type H+-transporting ATPase subunit epsilon
MSHPPLASDGKRLRCTVVTADRPLFDGPANFVVVPGPDDGEVGFMPRHAAYMAILGFGVMRINESPGHVIRFAVYGGFVQVVKDHVTVLANRAQKIEEISQEHIEVDRREIEGMTSSDEESFRRKMEKMREAQARLQALRSAGAA